jgi:hypothetical protein
LVTQINTLRVVGEMDASHYVSGAAQKVAADKAMVTSGKEAATGIKAVGDAATATDTKISQAGNGIERLKRQFVTGYAASVDFDRGLKTVGAGLDKGKISADQASVAVENLSRKYGVAADASHLVAVGNEALSQAIIDANARIAAQSAAVDDLTASYQRMAAEARVAFAAEQSQASFNTQLGVSQPIRGSAAASASVFEEAAREADLYAKRAADLRAKLDPVAASQARLNAELAEYSTLASRAEISTKELGQAELIAKARHDQFVTSMSRGGANDNSAIGRRQNLGYQVFDVGQGLSQGMPLGMIAAQQGPQIAQLYAGQGGLKAALSDVGALASGALAAIGPIGIAFGVTGAAALAYYTLTKRETKTTDELLKAHQESIKRVSDLWDDAAEQRSKYGRVSTDVVTLGLDNSIGDLTKRLRENVSSGAIGSEISSAINVNMDKTGMSAGEFRQSSIFKQLKIDFDALHEATVKGRPDVFGLIQRLQDIRRNDSNSGIRQMAEDALEALKPFRDLAEALREADQARRRLFEDRGNNGRLLSRGTTNTADMSSYAAFAAGQDTLARRSKQAYDAQISGINALSPQQKADASMQSAAAQYNNDETPAARRMRIEQAGSLALAQAEKTLKDAQEARGRNLDKIVADQQLEISLIGKTAGEASAMRREYELINQLKDEARQNGGVVSEDELSRVRETTAELAKMVDALARAKLGDELNFERQQLDRSPRDQAIASRQRGAGLPVNLNSDDAQNMREIENIKELREQGKGFITDLVNGLRGGQKIGEAFGEAILNGLSRAADKQMDRLVDSFLSWLFPASGGGSPAASGTGVVGSIIGAANDNKTFANPVAAVSRAPLGDLASYAGAIRKTESGSFAGDYSALGPVTRNGDRAYGAYQVMGNNVGPWSKAALGRSMSASEFLTDKGAQDAVFNHRFGGYVDKYGANGAAQAWFGGPGSVGKGGMGTDILGTSGNGYVQKFETNVGQLTAATTAATQSIGQLGTGLGGLSQQLMAAASGANAPGGGLFSSLFRGVSPTSSMWSANTTLGSFLVNGHADGVEYSQGGMAMVGERGRELVNLPRGSQVIPNHRTESLMARTANNNSGRMAVDVGVSVDNGGNLQAYVKNVARATSGAEVGQRFADFGDMQRRGGVNDVNRRYASQKG